MVPREQDHRSQHEASVKNVEEPFVRDQISVIPLSVLGQTEDRSDQNECAAAVQGVKMSSPRVLREHALAGGYPVHADVEGDADNNEEAEEQNLGN